MYGKLFTSLYTGSMIGAGPVVFALMPYVISHAKPDKNMGGYVELNPILLSTIFGAAVEEVEGGIEFLCRPDPHSRTPDEDGRRLVKLGPFDYRVVNYAKYRAIRDEEERREQNRMAQERFRAKAAAKRTFKLTRKAKGQGPLPGEVGYLKAVEDGRNGDAEHLEEHPPSNVEDSSSGIGGTP